MMMKTQTSTRPPRPQKLRRGTATAKSPKAAAKKKHGRALGWAFMAPSLLGVAAFFVLPFIVVIYYAVVNNPVQHVFVGLRNFISVLNNAAFQQASKNTATFSLIAVPMAVVLSLLLALLLEAKIPFRSQFRTFFLSPMMVPIASIVLIWQVLFHYNGVLNQLTAHFGNAPLDWLKSDYSQVVVMTLFLWKNLGYNMILFMAALGNVPKELLETSTLDGAGSFTQFWRIKLHYISPSILFVTILSLINSFKVFREVYLLTGDHPYGDLYLLQHFMNNTFGSLDYQKLSAAAILMSLVMVVIIGILFVAENHLGKDVEE